MAVVMGMSLVLLELFRTAWANSPMRAHPIGLSQGGGVLGFGSGLVGRKSGL